MRNMKAAHILAAAASRLNAERMTFPPDEDESGTWAEASLTIDGESIHVRVEITRGSVSEDLL